MKSEPLLMREFGSGSRRVVEQALSKAGVKTKDLTISMELDSTEGLLSAVEAALESLSSPGGQSAISSLLER